MGGYIVASSLEASENESDNGFGSVDDAKDDDDGSPSDARCLLDLLAICHS